MTAYIQNIDYDKVVTLFYTNRQDVSTALSAVALNYNASVENNFELWASSTPIYFDGITRLLNITFQDTDSGKAYVQILNLPVSASGAPEPTPNVTPPLPYATTSRFSNDITQWLAPHGNSAAGLAKSLMFTNINPDITGAAAGTVVAAQSGPSYAQKDPDYEYNWVRDASLTMDVVQSFYAAARSSASVYETILFQYAIARATEQNDPGLQTGLGEPKFYLNNTIFTGPWGAHYI